MKSKIKIYSIFSENEFKRNIAYKGSFYLFVLCSMFSVFINFYLWMAIYSDNQVINGMTKNEMIVYVFMSFIISTIVMIDISDNMTNDVIKGDIIMNLIKPIDYRLTLISRAIGIMCYRFIVPSVFIWIGLEIYRVTCLDMEFTGILSICLFLISTIFSFFIYVLLDFTIGIVGFFTTYIYGLNLAKKAIISFLSGALIPISFFPSLIQDIFSMLPFSSLVYNPVMIYLNKYSGEEILFVFLKQIIWILILYVLGKILWNKVTKKIIVLGG